MQSPSKSAAAALLLGAVLISGLISGCENFPGNSFERQIEELQWSAVTLTEQPRWQEELLWDLEVMTKPEFGKLEETLTLFGW